MLLGIGARPLVLLVAQEARIQGVLSVGADRLSGERLPGAGGFRGGPTALVPGEGPGAGEAASQNRSGAGGAGHGLAGGPGGAGEAQEDIGPGGLACGDPTLVPLVGGSGGGASFGLGGNGGGALQVSAGRYIRVGPGGMIDACGGGGRGGSTNTGGGGGGAGGSILLEASVVDILGAVGANGGAGGQAGYFNGTNSWGGVAGEPGQPDVVPALAAEGQGMGGNGSNMGGVPRDGQPGSTWGSDCGGGGGGAGGRIRINTFTGTESYPVGLLPNQESGLTTVGQLDLTTP